MLKTFNFALIIFLNVFSLCYSAEPKKINNIIVINNKSIESANFNGKWNYEFNSDENELLNRTFQLNLVQKNNIIKGQYCAVARNGGKIDCLDKEINNITGIIKDNIAYIEFTGFYDSKAKGKAKLYFNGKFLVWEILEVKGEIYAPKKATLINENKINGLYVLKSCESSRFSIKIDIKNSDYNYSIIDKTKIILKGKAIINKTQIKLGKIEGVISDNDIVIQNYGNSMNEYNHFTQCDEKYLTFEKVKY
jgi:hypothetical protein